MDVCAFLVRLNDSTLLVLVVGLDCKFCASKVIGYETLRWNEAETDWVYGWNDREWDLSCWELVCATNCVIKFHVYFQLILILDQRAARFRL